MIRLFLFAAVRRFQLLAMVFAVLSITAAVAAVARTKPYGHRRRSHCRAGGRRGGGPGRRKRRHRGRRPGRKRARVYLIDPTHTPVMTISSGRGIANGNGLEGLQLPAAFGAIAKAITGAYLSSAGNAFSTRTASQIVQENFNPGELGAPGGPLFGVQFSQLPCSDISGAGDVLSVGPRRSPLGLSADRADCRSI